jgi:hypothetical protein
VLVFEGDVEVEVEGELEVVLDPPGVVELVVDEVGGELVVVVVLVDTPAPLLDGVQDADWTVLPGGAPGGRPTCDGVVPAGTLTTNVCVPPVSSRTVTVHVSAAAGALPKTSVAIRALASASAEISFRRRVKAALPQQPSWSCALQCVNEGTLRRGPGRY